jgi:hypothetical protein
MGNKNNQEAPMIVHRYIRVVSFAALLIIVPAGILVA